MKDRAPPRLVRRTPERKRSRQPLWYGSALLACAGLLAVAAAGLFRVKHVEVVGANVPVDKIVQTAAVTGQNVFTVRSDQVVARVSRIREIVVERVDTTFPDRVTIYATERTPAVAWLSGKRQYELDANGSIIRRVVTTRLPVIAGPEPQTAVGQGIVQGVRYAVHALAGVPDGSIARFRYEPRTGLSIDGRAGWTAEVGNGTPQHVMDRIATLAGLLVSTRNRPGSLQFVDLRLSSVYARFRGA
jgi:cell division septal protein FtsQ